MQQHEPTDHELQEADLKYIKSVLPVICRRLGLWAFVDIKKSVPLSAVVRIAPPRGDVYVFALSVGSIYGQWTVEAYGKTCHMTGASTGQLMGQLIGFVVTYEIAAVTLDMG